MDIDDGPTGAFAFTEKSVRRGFIRKVYAILCVQLVVTLGFILLFILSETVKTAMRENPNMIWIPVSLSIVFVIFLACCTDLRRRSPLNFIFLGLFTICEGITLGAIASTYDAKEVGIAIGATTIIVAGLTVFAFQTKIDFTMMAGAIFCLSMSLISFGIFALIFQSEVLYMFYSCLGAFVFSLYIVFDTQLILGGKHKISLSPEEYIFAALNLYLDIINLFLMLLSLQR